MNWIVLAAYAENLGFTASMLGLVRDAGTIAQDRANNSFSEDDTDAQAYNIGLFYTMPAGTELRLTYSKVDNEDNSGYDFGIGGTNLWNVTDDNSDEDVSMVSVGIVHWFD